jgi:microcystin-dependent protein
MATTTTYSLIKPTVGGDENTWGQSLNDNFDSIDDLLDGTTAIAPNLTAGSWEVGGVAVTATAAELNTLDGINTASNFGLVPSGAILLWSGSVASIPSGWLLCDGTNGTPNLQNRFVVGAGDTYAVDATGGAASVTLTEAQLPAHTHGDGTLAAASAGAHTHSFYYGSRNVGGGTPGGFGLSFFGSPMTAADDAARTENRVKTDMVLSGGAHTHDVTGATGSTGSGDAVATLPPYYALAYIMKA